MSELKAYAIVWVLTDGMNVPKGVVSSETYAKTWVDQDPLNRKMILFFLDGVIAE